MLVTLIMLDPNYANYAIMRANYACDPNYA